jgi:hypothetical protein
LDPNDGQVGFVGTAGNGSDVNTNGYVHRTLDGGQTWISATVDIGYGICSIAVDPNNNNNIWAVSGPCNYTFPDHSAVFSSTNRGLSFSLMLISTNGNEFQQVAFDPSGVLYIAGDGVRVSHNGGVIWLDATTGLQQVTVEQIGGNPKFPQVLYASSYLGFARSLDGGKTWKFPAGEIGGRCFAVNPENPSIVFVCKNGASQIFYSANSGDTWSSSVITNSNATVTSVAIDQIITQTVYASLSTHWQNPSGDTNRDGVFISTNSGQDWEFFGLAGEQINAMVAVTDTSGTIVYAAVGDRSIPSSTGGVYRWRTGETSWTLMGMSDAIVNNIAVDPRDPTHLYCAVGVGGPGLIVKGIFESKNSGENWLQVNFGGNPEIGQSVHFDIINPDIVYAAETRTLYRTKDGGDTWLKFSEIVNQGEGFYSVYVSPEPYPTIYVGMHDGAYYKNEYWVYLPLVIR